MFSISPLSPSPFLLHHKPLRHPSAIDSYTLGIFYARRYDQIKNLSGTNTTKHRTWTYPTVVIFVFLPISLLSHTNTSPHPPLHKIAQALLMPQRLLIIIYRKGRWGGILHKRGRSIERRLCGEEGCPAHTLSENDLRRKENIIISHAQWRETIITKAISLLLPQYIQVLQFRHD